jgi:hypothetical protein
VFEASTMNTHQRRWTVAVEFIVLVTLITTGGLLTQKEQVEDTTTSGSNTARTAALWEYLERNFGSALGEYEASWFSNIEELEVGNDTVKVQTNIYPDADAAPAVNPIRAAIFGYAHSHVSAGGYIKWVVINSSTGSTILEARTLN